MTDTVYRISSGLLASRSARGRARADAQGRCDGAGSEEIGDHPPAPGQPPAGGLFLTGWPEAVTRLRLPQNPACGFPALGSSEVDSQFGEGLQLRVREVELRFKQRELRLDPLELLPRDRSVPAPTAQYFAPIAFHGPMDL